VKAALELGFLDLDTAPHYGLGLSETRLGRAVAMHGGGRPVRLWSKVGRVMKPHAEVTAEEGPRAERGNMPGAPGCIFPDSPTDVTPVLDYTGEGVKRSHADSLKRLGAAAVEGLRVHDAEDEERFAQAMAPGGGIDALVWVVLYGHSTPGGVLHHSIGHMPHSTKYSTYKMSVVVMRNGAQPSTLNPQPSTLNPQPSQPSTDEPCVWVELRGKGMIKSVSLGMNDPAYVMRMITGKPAGTFDSIMSAGAWNLIDQDGYELMLECQKRGIKVHNAGIFASGLLVGKGRIPLFTFHVILQGKTKHIQLKTARWGPCNQSSDTWE
jgi:aryl-alcohol dehydrogenase-like predicted oxidoreductase